MTIPTLLFALLIAVGYAALYHLVRGGGVGRLLFYVALTMAGFALGHAIGLWQGWVFFPLGALNLGLSSVGSLLLLVLGDWLSRIEADQESTV